MNCRRLLLSLAFTAAISAPVVAAEEIVQLREAPVREKAAPIAPIVGNVKYGDRINVLEVQGKNWKRIETMAENKLTGWVNAAALIPKDKLKLNSTGTPTSVTNVEGTLAAGGINPRVAGDYVNQNNLQNAAAQLDAIERNPLFKASPEEMRAFLAQGNLTPKGGN